MPARLKTFRRKIVIEADGVGMGKSTYEIRVAGTVPLELLENFRQIEAVEPAGTILHAVQLDDAALWGLIDALRRAGIDLIEVRRQVSLDG